MQTLEVELVIRRTDRFMAERFLISLHGPDSKALDELREGIGESFPGLEEEGSLEAVGDWKPHCPPPLAIEDPLVVDAPRPRRRLRRSATRSTWSRSG